MPVLLTSLAYMPVHSLDGELLYGVDFNSVYLLSQTCHQTLLTERIISDALKKAKASSVCHPLNVVQRRAI